MKKTLLLLALVMGAGTISFAQTTKPVATKNEGAATKMTPAQHIDARVQRLTKNLNLTAAQQTSIKQIMTTSYSQMESAKQANDRTKADQVKNQMHEQILAQLTPEQKIKFGQFQAKNGEATTKKVKAN